MTKAITKSHDHLTLALFSLTLFVSAALMFGLQPMAGRMLLPIIGGTPAGWIVAMAFFQVMLLAGYFLAHLLSRLPPALHGFVFLLVIALGLLFLPARISAETVGDVPGAFGVFKLLLATMSLPFIAISATSSTLQRLFSVSNHRAASDPYFLYAASNLGSFAGLFAYPLLAEPLLGLTAQSHYWFYGYSLLIVMIGLCLIIPATTPAAYQMVRSHKGKKLPAVDIKTKLSWLLYAFIPSSLLMAVSTHITTDIFSAPMLWVLPLGLYLLTFVLAFARKLPFSAKDINRLHIIAVAAGLGFLLLLTTTFRISWIGLFIQLFSFTVAVLMCHMQLAAQRPPDSTRHLTGFYLYIALGGALGGVLSAFVIPHVLDRLAEYPLLLIASLLLNPRFREKMSLMPKMYFGLGCVMTFFYISYIATGSQLFESLSFTGITSGMLMIDIFLAMILLFFATSARGAFMGLLGLFVFSEFVLPKNVQVTERNFFGVIKVYDQAVHINGQNYTTRYLRHGSTLHGMQIIEEPMQKTLTSYYAETGPAGNVFQIYNPGNVAVIGLGVGTLACYSTPESRFTFLEIDPAMVTIAQEQFSFIKDCMADNPPRIIIGDGRIEIGKLKDEKFDLIVLDAFSSDTIPTHLLTVEALQTYNNHLTENGIILANLSNRYFNLAPALIKNADQTGMTGRVRLDRGTRTGYTTASFWAAFAKRDGTLYALDDMGWNRVNVPQNIRPWTDDYTNLLRTLEFRL